MDSRFCDVVRVSVRVKVLSQLSPLARIRRYVVSIGPYAQLVSLPILETTLSRSLRPKLHGAAIHVKPFMCFSNVSVCFHLCQYSLNARRRDICLTFGEHTPSSR